MPASIGEIRKKRAAYLKAVRKREMDYRSGKDIGIPSYSLSRTGREHDSFFTTNFFDVVKSIIERRGKRARVLV